MTPKQFFKRFICAYFLLLVLVGIFNRVVDPSWYYRDVSIKGFNAMKPEFISFERDIKPALLIRDQPEAIILGSSYSEVGLNPNNFIFADYGRLKSMNFAFAKASWEKVQCDFEFAVTHSHIKRAVVGFHPGSLPIANCAKDFASIGQLNTIDLLLTYSALEYSIKTILKQRLDAGGVFHTWEGMFFYNRFTCNSAGFREGLRAQASACKKTMGAKNSPINSDSEPALDLSGLQRMIRTAKAHGVELALFAYPNHASLLELEMQCGRQEAKWQDMKQIAVFIESESAGQVRAWQFYGYNNVTSDPTSEPIGAKVGYWQDTHHFNFEVGDMMLADMFDKNRGKPLFGQPLNTDYSDFLRERAKYLQHHPEFQANLEKLYLAKPSSQCRN